MLTPDDLRNAEFRTVRRGYDPDEVEALLYRIALEIETTAMYLAGEASDEGEPRVTASAPGFFELGVESAAMIGAAERMASTLRAEGARRAAAAEAEARRQAAALLADARAIIVDERDRCVRQAVADAAAAERDRALAEVVLADARANAEGMVSEARSVRERLLDHAQRRADEILEDARRSASRTLVESRLLADARVAGAQRFVAEAEARAEALSRLAAIQYQARRTEAVRG